MAKEEKALMSPIGGNRGCLCKDNTYKRECCNGGLWEQGVGSLVNQTQNTTIKTTQTRTRSSSYS
jgi:hypothetical protein